MVSPRTGMLISEITKVISPEPSPEVQAAQKNKRQRRRRVQAKTGEVLTEESCMARLQEEENVRNAKKASKGKGKAGKRGAAKNGNKKAAEPSTSQAIQQEVSQAAHQDEEDSETEVTVRRPRKKLRKLIVASDNEEEEETSIIPPKPTVGILVNAFGKLLSIEDLGSTQDFETIWNLS